MADTTLPQGTVAQWVRVQVTDTFYVQGQGASVVLTALVLSVVSQSTVLVH